MKSKKILVNFYIESYDSTQGFDDYPQKYYISRRFDGNIKFNELIKYLMMKYIKPTAENLKKPYCYSINFYDVLWGEYFKQENNFMFADGVDNNDPQSLKLELWKLDKQFDLSNKQFELLICGPGIGGGVGNYDGIKFYFHTREKDRHQLPHIHCSYSGEEISVDIQSLRIMGKAFKNNSKTKKALELIKKNQKGLINYWNRVVINGEYLKFEMVYF